MRILSNLASYETGDRPPLILAIGNFDGLHLGHRKLLSRVTGRARGTGLRSAVLTFREHPQHVLHPSSKPPLLTSNRHKIFLLDEAGIDLCFLIPFTPEFSQLAPDRFVSEILVKTFNVREVYLGHNARFGHDRTGSVQDMQDLARQHGFVFEEIGPVKSGDEMVSSSRVRALVREGRLGEAAACLGRPFSVLGEVVHGAGRGAGLGFPTANLEVESEILPPMGVYPVKARVLDFEEKTQQDVGIKEVNVKSQGWMEGILNYGYRPTFDGKSREAVPEAYFFDFEGALYGRQLELAFYEKLRGEMRFNGAPELCRQIKKDIEAARFYFRGLSK